MNVWDQMRDALNEADNLDSAVSTNSNRMAGFLTRHRCANLHRVSSTELRKIKRELRNFDMVTGTWKR